MIRQTNRRLLLALPLAAQVGCTQSQPTCQPGTNCTVGAMQFNWSFAAPNGGTSCIDADVNLIQITLGDGDPQDFPCESWESGAGQSAELHAVPIGGVAYTITGLSYSTDLLGEPNGAPVQAYSATGTATVVSGEVASETPTLTLLGSKSNSTLDLLWTFNSESCDQAGVATVAVSVDGAAPVNEPCTSVSDAGTAEGVALPGFAAGAHTFVLTANGASAAFYGKATVFANGYASSAASVDLGVDSAAGQPPAAGDGNLDINLTFGGSAMCGTNGANIDDFQYFLTDDTGAMVSNMGATTPSVYSEGCADAVRQVSYLMLRAIDTYFLSVEGLSNGTVTYQLTNAALTVYPGPTLTYAIDVPALATL